MSLLEIYNELYGELLLESVQKSKVIKAIEERDVISIYYLGDKTIKRGWRKIRPFTFGLSKAGNPVLRAYQFEGPSDSEDKPMWRMFRLDRVQTWNKTFKKFDFNDPEMMRDYN